MSTINGSLLAAASVHGSKLSAAAEIARTQLDQDTEQPYGISPLDWRVWDAPGTPIGTAASDDLGLAAGTFGTDVVTITTGDVKATNSTRRALTRFVVPPEYDENQTIKIRGRAGMETTVADTSCTLDFEVYKVDRSADGTAGSDLCATGAASMNSLTEADLDFTITSTDISPGDELEIRMSVAYNDSATGTTVEAVVYKVEVLLDIRG